MLKTEVRKLIFIGFNNYSLAPRTVYIQQFKLNEEKHKDNVIPSQIFRINIDEHVRSDAGSFH